MTARDFVYLAFRLFGVFLLINTLSSVPAFYASFVAFMSYDTASPSIGMILITHLGLLIPIAIGLGLWFRADWFIERLFNDPPLEEYDSADEPASEPDMAVSEESADPPLGVESIQAAAFSVIGLWILTSAVPDFITTLWHGFEKSPDDALQLFKEMFSVMRPPDFVAVIVRLAIGLWLFLGSAGIAGLLRKLRTRNRITIGEME